MTIASAISDDVFGVDVGEVVGLEEVMGLGIVKKLVEEVLDTEGYSDKRAARLGKEDFLCLLAAFNAKGIHFA